MRASVKNNLHASFLIAPVVVMLSLLSSCFLPSSKAPQNASAPATPENDKPGVVIPSGNIPRPSSNSTSIPYMGGIISTRVIAGKVYIPVEGTFSDSSFAKLQESTASLSPSQEHAVAQIGVEIDDVIATIQKTIRLTSEKKYPKVAFFSALIALDDYSLLSSVADLKHQVLINPVIEEVSLPPMSAVKNPSELTLGLSSARSDTASFSGLEPIGVKEFLKTTKTELGEDVDGSQVHVGITDTGITFNHPAFFDAGNQSRIVYMKDFTGEGQIYFPDTAKLEARDPLASEVPAGVTPTEAVMISAKYILTPNGRELPIADMLSDVTNQLFLVTPDLKALLLTPNSGARLGVISESAFANSSDKEFIDINHNSKNDDLLWALLVPSPDLNQSQVFVDLSGNGDFRRSPALTNWNTSRKTITSFSETFGLDVKAMNLRTTGGALVPTIAAAVVGFDPGNHGSHVAGIIGARKTIANDVESTNARGVAPNTKLMMNRVCANNSGCIASEAIIDLALNGAEIINMSLGGLNPWNDGYGVQETIINRLSQVQNTLFVISAGNSGPGVQTVGSPSVAGRALSVAATATPDMVERQYQWPGSGKTNSSNSEADFVLFFSSRGPTAAGGFKPNISAPGSQLSTVQLNAASGSRSGLDVYWGTSMAAPTAAGAAALLIDAAKRYNLKNPTTPLPLDSASLQRVLLASAKAFDTNFFDPKSGKRTLGQYTWIDQGHGMINLPNAWKALKKERDQRLPSAVWTVDANAQRVDIPLNYDVRVLRKSPNGNDYTGAITAPVAGEETEPRYGRGIYLDMKEADSLIGVQIVRSLPESARARADVGNLTRMLITTADQFELETVYYGSSATWLKAGTLARLDCLASPSSDLTVIGTGPTDSPGTNGSPSSSTPLGASNLNVCIDRELIKTLPPGDHGAVIKGFRKIGGKKEAHPSFEVPVYISKPHATVAGRSQYRVDGTVKSFAVHRNYIKVPEGVSVLKLTLEVPEAQVSGNAVKGCSGVEFMILEGLNTAKPTELTPRTKARVANCDATGAVSSKRSVTLTRSNPRAGVWDVHVFGQYSFAESAFTLVADFANVKSSVTEIMGTTTALKGVFDFAVVDSSIAVNPTDTSSSYEISGISQVVLADISQDASVPIVNLEGTLARIYDDTVGSVTFTTGKMPGSDIDLFVRECDDAAMTKCQITAQSGGPADDETVTITPIAGKFYVPEVLGFTVASTPAQFTFTESLAFKASEKGTLTITPRGTDHFDISYDFDIDNSEILSMPQIQSGLWSAAGNIEMASSDSVYLRIPVSVKK